MHQYSYQFPYLSCLFFQKIIGSMTGKKIYNFPKPRDQNTRSLATLDIPSGECGCGMVSIIFIFIHFAFWMGQQPSIPEESSQVLVPSGHWYFLSWEETSPEVPMKPLLFFAVSICCEGILLAAFRSIPAATLRQSLPVPLTSTAACTPNTDENWYSHSSPRQSANEGQQCKRSRQQVVLMPNGQQRYPPYLHRQHFWFGQDVPSGHRFLIRD